MTWPILLMLLIMLLGILGGSQIIAGAAGILLVLQIVKVEIFFSLLERKGLEIGLVFLMLSVLIPFAVGRISFHEIMRAFVSLPGVVAIVSGTLATHLNGKGLELLQLDPSLIIGLVIGSIIGVVFFDGIPVGPLMAGGIAALIMGILNMRF
ncbi:MAG: DUF441 domain-containing protein [Clostridia bacterium]|nr:DUF441 domain-containing protein [Clostridia bacterium]